MQLAKGKKNGGREIKERIEEGGEDEAVGERGMERHYRKNDQRKRCHLQRKGNLEEEKGEMEDGKWKKRKEGSEGKIKRES